MRSKMLAAVRTVLTPVATILAVFMSANGATMRTSMDMTAAEVVNYLRQQIDGTGRDWQWEAFLTLPIDDPDLLSIRNRARQIELPLDETGLGKLSDMLAEAEAEALVELSGATAR